MYAGPLSDTTTVDVNEVVGKAAAALKSASKGVKFGGGFLVILRGCATVLWRGWCRLVALFGGFDKVKTGMCLNVCFGDHVRTVGVGHETALHALQFPRQKHAKHSKLHVPKPSTCSPAYPSFSCS